MISRISQVSQPSIQLGGRRVSAADPCYVIAEIGVNHNGDPALAHAMIDAAKDAGRKSILLLVRRDGDPRFVALSLE